MILPFLLFILAYGLVGGLLPNKPDLPNWRNAAWLKPAAFFATAAVFSFLFGTGSYVPVLSAALVSAALQYAVYAGVQPRLKDNLSSFFGHQAVQVALIYLVLLLFGQAGTPGWMLEQLSALLFAKKLVVEEKLIVPAVLVVLIFVTFTSSEIVHKFLNKFGNPIAPHVQEAAAALEPMMEGSLLQKQTLKQGNLADMAVEEQIEVSNEADELNPVKTKQSIKVQYHWYNKEEESSKGKYIGILERLLICVFVYYEIYQGLVLIGAMKTLARFKLFDNKAFAEYYLIGTLLSLLIAVACGFLLRRLLLIAVLV